MGAQDTLVVPGGAALLAAAGCGPLSARVSSLSDDCVCLLLRVAAPPGAE
jgi:hypothetical protein